jgi:hypothetical protein
VKYCASCTADVRGAARADDGDATVVGADDAGADVVVGPSDVEVVDGAPWEAAEPHAVQPTATITETATPPTNRRTLRTAGITRATLHIRPDGTSVTRSASSGGQVRR